MDPIFAHSLPGRPTSAWEPLSHHLREVGDRAAGFADRFGWGEAGRAAGLLHDIGKCSAAFQTYIAQASDDGGPRGPDHSTAGAREAERLYGKTLGRMLAYAVAGHHAGLPDYDSLEERVGRKRLEPYEGWERHVGVLPGRDAVRPKTPLVGRTEKGFAEQFLTRMLFSCLVDADSLATERFREGHIDRTFTGLTELRNRLATYMRRLETDARPSDVNRLRAEVLAHATAKAAMAPGLFTLTVPTGGGKTLASLSFALEHAVRHGLDRVIYVIPFTSIIEQTAEVFRTALGTQADVLEHHASFDWERPPKTVDKLKFYDSEGPDGLRKLRRASENWDAPVVVTTAVQFFESLFANRRSRCRKLHNIARSVIVLDEAQTLPLPVLRPSLAAIDELARNYGSSVVVCTATQPAWRKSDRKLFREKNNGDRVYEGLNVDDEHELAPDPPRLYTDLKRVDVSVLPGETANESIVEAFAQSARMLCIVNNRAHARALYDAIAAARLEGVVHLSTLMCPVHRSRVLDEVRQALAAGRPARVVSTSLIEAGVDISFPEVWRASTGLDSIAQAAGRCNRNDELKAEGRRGRVVVFTPTEEWKPPRELKVAQLSTTVALRGERDPLALDTIAAYFGDLYRRKGPDDLDPPEISVLGVKVKGVLNAIEKGADECKFPFAGVAENFRLIKEVLVPVVVPYNDEAEAALKRVVVMDRPLREDLQKLQRYTVNIPRDAHALWLARNAIVVVRPDLKQALTRFADLKSHYREATGVDLTESTYRLAETNVIA